MPEPGHAVASVDARPHPVTAHSEAALSVRFWGTRGSIPAPGPATAGYGGNTPCLEARFAGQRVIFDAGSGIRQLGIDLIEKGEPLGAAIFLTHFHWDHIQGFPFFGPMYRREARLRVIGPMQENLDVQSLFAGQMGPIYFPVPFEAVAARMTFEHLNEGTWEDGGITVKAMRVRHPSFTVGYRLEAGGRSFCYIPDNELTGGDYPVGSGWRERLVRFCGEADLLVHDAMFTDEEYAATRKGWGHSTFRQSLDLAAAAGVKRLLFFHHAPERTDAQLAEIVERRREEAAARKLTLDVDAADEGTELSFE